MYFCHILRKNPQPHPNDLDCILLNSLINCQIQLSAWSLDVGSWQHLFQVELANLRFCRSTNFPNQRFWLSVGLRMQFATHELLNQNQSLRVIQHLEFQKKASPYNLVYLTQWTLKDRQMSLVQVFQLHSHVFSQWNVFLKLL